MKLETKLILLCHVASLVICKPPNSKPKNSSGIDIEYVVGGSLNGSEIDAKYTFENKLHGNGFFGDVYLGTTNTKPKMHVAMKLENEHGEKREAAANEIKIYRHLHEKYGDLVRYHLINMLDHGKYKDERNAVIYVQTGPSLDKEKPMKKLRPNNKPDWPKICKIMTELDAVEHLHRVDVVHRDISKVENVAFGREKEPANGRLPGVTYENDAYVLDLGNANIIVDIEDPYGNSRFDDLTSIGCLLCRMLIGGWRSNFDLPHESRDIKAYFDNEDPYKTFSPEIRAALVNYHEALKELEQRRLTEQQLKTEIDYYRLRSFFK